MRPNLYEASRALTTPGFTADIYFNPSQITNRLKKSIQKQITNCAVTKGYASKAARIAKHLMDQYEIPYSSRHWSGVDVRIQDEQAQHRAVEIVQANLAAYLLDSPYNAEYEKRRARDDIEAIKRGEQVYVRLHSIEFADQMLMVMSKFLPPDTKDKARALAERLDDPTPIKINIKNWSI